MAVRSRSWELTILAPAPASIELKRERIDYWVSKGAKMSDRVSKIVSKPAPVRRFGCLIFRCASR